MAEIKYLVWIWKRSFLGIYFKVPVVRTAHVDRQTAKRLGRGFTFEKLMWHDPDKTMLKGAAA